MSDKTLNDLQYLAEAVEFDNLWCTMIRSTVRIVIIRCSKEGNLEQCEEASTHATD